MLFTSSSIATLTLKNRLIRSATAEKLADESGRPREQLEKLYRELARGGVALIITGHMYIHPSGKAHPEMTGVYSDELIPDLSNLADAVHQENGKIIVQINHGGMQCSPDAVENPIAPSDIAPPLSKQPAREMTQSEVIDTIQAFGNAAGRVKEAGFDGVQIHAAHGYLINQFLSPYTNKRQDDWGGSFENRCRFLVEVIKTVRGAVGRKYPILIKLGMVDNVAKGLSPNDTLRVLHDIQRAGIDAVEISGGIGGGTDLSIRKGIRSPSEEAYFRPIARRARTHTELPIILVGGLRSRDVMEDVLSSGDADFISLCRPLITEPDFPNLLKSGQKDVSRCISSNNCWPESIGEGIGCKCPLEKLNT